MSNVVHFEYRNIPKWDTPYDSGAYHYGVSKNIGCGTIDPDKKVVNLDRVTCGRCKRSRAYKAYRAFVIGLIDKKMLNEIGLVVSRKLA